MSKYSLDSLDNIEEDSLEKSILMNNDNNENDNDNNLIAIKSSSADKFVKDISFHLNPILTTLHGIKGINERYKISFADSNSRKKGFKNSYSIQ